MNAAFPGVSTRDLCSTLAAEPFLCMLQTEGSVKVPHLLHAHTEYKSHPQRLWVNAVGSNRWGLWNPLPLQSQRGHSNRVSPTHISPSKVRTKV